MSQPDTASDASAATAEIPPELAQPSLARRLRLPLMIGGPLLLVLLIAVVYFGGGRYESTDDAYVRVGTVGISANIAGRVVEVDVKENQRVKAGDVLFRLDPQPIQIAEAQAQAQLANARAGIVADVASFRQKQVELKAAQDTADYQERERVREQALAAAGAVSKAEYDQAAHAADAARHQVDVAVQELAALRARLGGAPDAALNSHPEVRVASAAVARSTLEQSYTVVRAPQDGIVTKVSQLQVGSYINASQPVFNLVTNDIWVEADFKENQLHHTRVGDAATVKIDAYPGHTFNARVESLSPGTDQSFSLLPAENSSGNWVKVVQRLPLRLVFTRPPEIQLQGGLSAKVKVDTGFSRNPFAPARRRP